MLYLKITSALQLHLCISTNIVLLQNHPQLCRKSCYTLLFNTHNSKIVKAHIFNVYNIECNTVCEFKMVVSQKCYSSIFVFFNTNILF